MSTLIVTKPLRYASRSMVPGDTFDAIPRDARLLVAIGKARYDTKAAETGDLSVLRAEYQSVVGKKPFHGWSAETIKAKIAEAK